MGQIDSVIEPPVLPAMPLNRLTVVGVGGTKRAQSSSEKAVRRALSFAEALGATTHLIAGEALPDEIYDPGSRERSRQARNFVERLREADVLIVSTPSYHGSVSGCIKNALDYVEDMRADERPYLDGVPVGVICCAMGWQAGGATLSAMRSIVHSLRGWPTPLGVIVNTQISSFNPDFVCSDPAVDSQIRTMVHQAMHFADVNATARNW